jgi:hypothetical protein
LQRIDCLLRGIAQPVERILLTARGLHYFVVSIDGRIGKSGFGVRTSIFLLIGGPFLRLALCSSWFLVS